MKANSIFFILFLLTTFQCYSQNNNEFKIYYGITDSELLRNESLAGSASYDNNNAYEFGFNYLKKISNRISLETGINFFKTNVEITPAFTGTSVNAIQEELSLLSIPIYLNYSLGKYFYINGGLNLGFQKGDESFDSQSGIGYGLGFGGKYNFNNFFIYVNPNFKRHAVIPLNKENYHQKLTQVGLQIGIGYKF